MAKVDNSDIGSDEISLLLSIFGARLTPDQLSKVREYVRILLKWNELTGLTSIIDPAEIVSRHFGESMFLASILPVENCRLADVGSGAGFPGLALKVFCPGLHVTLIESSKKKCAFLSEVVRSLDMDGAEVLPTRYEEIRERAGFADIVTARAVGGFSSLLRWASRSLSERGHTALWVGGEDTTKISKTAGWTWQPAVRIPESQRRFILVGRPVPRPIP